MTPELKAAVGRYLERRGGSPMRPAAAQLSSRYREGGTSAAIDLAAYLTVRLPATFAAVSYAMAEVRRLRPSFAPRSFLDAGAGPGTAAWAASELWPGLEAVTFLDNDPQFLALALELAQAGPNAAVRAARGVQGDMSGNLPAAELVTAAYALAELPANRQEQAIAALWQASRDHLILVEPGTPGGFARLRAARDQLLAAGAVLVAPCPHAGQCPMAGEDWCHFAVRLPRSRAHMHAKQAHVPFEDEKFSYVAVARDGAPSAGARILAPPVKAKPGLTFKLCTPQGLEWRHIARRAAAAYKAHRKKDWGDLL